MGNQAHGAGTGGGTMGRMSQKQRVINHLLMYGSITDSDARKLYGISRLSGRIYDLRRELWPIKTMPERGLNMFGEETVYGRYVMDAERGANDRTATGEPG